jgi:PAS domain S-box-containing protein
MDSHFKSRLDDLEFVSRLREENEVLRSALSTTEYAKSLFKLREEFSLLLEASKLITSELDVNKVLEMVAQKARDIVKADLVVVPMLNEGRDEYAYMAAAGTGAEQVIGQRFAANVGMCGWVLQNERSLLYGKSTPFLMDEKTVWEAGQQSAVLVPLFGRKKIIGGVSALGKKGNGSFTQHDLDLLTMFANQVSTAIENAFLFQQVTREVEERKQVEDALRLSEVDLKEAQHIARLGRWELNLANNNLRWSDTIFDIFEIDRAQFGATYEAFLQAIHPDDRKMVNKAYTDSRKTKQPYEITHRLLMKDGRVKWVIEMCRTDYDAQGQAIRSVGIVQEITERMQAEEEVRRSRETLEKTFRSLDSALFILDNSDPPLVTECNPAATRMFGYEKEEMLGHTTEFLHVDKEALAEFQMKNYAALKEWGFLSSFVFRMKRRNGEIFPTEHSVFPLLDELGNRSGWVSVVKDITQRRRAEQQTKDSLNFIRTMMESSPIGVVSIKATGAVVAANETITRITGGTVEQLLKQNVRHLEAWKKYGLLSTMNEALATNSERRIETNYVSTFGKHMWLSVRFVPYTFEGEPHVLALLADTSDRKRDEAEKEKLQAQLLQAQKMEAVGQLAGGIAHDFNNILTAIIGYGNLARLKLRDDDPVRTYLDEIVLSADRAAALTQSLLAFGRKQTINPQLIDLNMVIKKIENLLMRIIGEDIMLTTALSDKPLVVFADAIQMEQVLMNLATNARDAMPNGGKFVIETERINIDDVFVRAHGYGEIGPYAMLILTDTGGGIEPDIKDRIFEPFFTTKEMGKGTGLGLAIVYGIVTQHNGHITVYSEIGKGTSFKILFPISEVRDPDSQLSESSTTLQRGTETVLLAEDHATVRELNKEILEEFGYRVIEAVDGQDALEKFARNKDTVQLLILDVIMPAKNGKEVYDAVKAMAPGIKVLFTSGYPAELIQKKGILEEGLQFITKPVEPRAFLAKIRKVLGN